MALLGDFDNNYTKTGNGTLNSWSGKLSYIPVIRKMGFGLSKIPIIGGPIVGVLGYADTIIESGKWLLRGKVGSAVTTAVAGTVGTTVNIASDTIWWANIGSGALTGRTLGTHARKLTETAIGGITGALGAKPTVLRSYPAGIGGLGAPAAPTAPGRFTSQVSKERNQNPDEAYQNYLKGEGGAYVNDLQSAYGRGA